MKKIIDGKRYDTESAREVGSDSYSNRGDFHHWSETLYCKRTGEYFLYGEGGPNSRYAKSTSQNEWSGGEAIRPLMDYEARKWAEQHLSAEEYEAEFSIAVEANSENIIGRNIARAREAAGMSQAELAKAIGATQAQISMYESGEQEPTASRIIAIENALNYRGDLLESIIYEDNQFQLSVRGKYLLYTSPGETKLDGKSYNFEYGQYDNTPENREMLLAKIKKLARK